jgi:hypothetical protein
MAAERRRISSGAGGIRRVEHASGQSETSFHAAGV